MTFATYLERDDVQFLWYMFIGGIPHVFSNYPQPSGWTLPTGYTWSQTFLVNEGLEDSLTSSMAAVSSKRDHERGVVISGDLDVSVWYDPEDPDALWTGLLAPATRNTWHVDNQRPIKPTENGFQLLDVTGISATDILYIGTEAIEVIVTVGATNVIGVNRGKFGSVQGWHGARGGRPGDPTIQTEIRDWPKVWRGRPISVWAAPAYVDNEGNVTPLSSALQGTEDQEIFGGIIYEMDWDVGRPVATFSCQSLDQLLERPVMSRPRIYSPGPPAVGSLGWTYVESGADRPNLVQYTIGDANFASMTTITGPPSDTLEITDLINGEFTTPQFVDADALMSGILTQLRAATQTVVSNLVTNGFQWDYKIDTEIGSDDPPKLQILVHRVLDGPVRTNILEPITFHIETADYPERAALRALGLTKDLVIHPDPDNLDTIHWEASTFTSVGVGDEPVPHYYFAKGSTRLYYHGFPINADTETQDPPASQGTVGRDGQPDFSRVRFGDQEMIEVAFRNPLGEPNLFTDTNFPDFNYALVFDRGMFTTSPKAITVPVDEIDEEEFQLRVVLGFDDHDLMDIARWLMVSNGDSTTRGLWSDEGAAYNVLPEGFGAAIPSSWVDLDSFERVQLARPLMRANNLVLEGSESLREFLGDIGLAYSLNFYGSLGSGTAGDAVGRYRISVSDLRPPPEAVSIAATVDQGWTNSTAHTPDHSLNERSVINKLVFNYNWDPIEREFRGKDNTILDADSISLYGESRALTINVSWLRLFSTARTVLQGMANRLFRYRGVPWSEYRVPYVTPEGWKLRPGDAVKFTHPWLQNYRDGGLGLTDALMEVIGQTININWSGGTAGELLLAWRNDEETRQLAPSFRVIDSPSANTYEIASNELQEGFSRTESLTIDRNFIDVDYDLRAYIPGVDTFQTGLTVTAVGTLGSATQNDITLNTAITLTPLTSVVLEFAPYDLAGTLDDEQENYAFLCDEETLVVTNSAAEEKPGTRWY